MKIKLTKYNRKHSKKDKIYIGLGILFFICAFIGAICQNKFVWYVGMSCGYFFGSLGQGFDY